jgi:hypothetical protein
MKALAERSDLVGRDAAEDRDERKLGEVVEEA